MSFQQNVLRVAIVLLIITSVIVFIMLYFSKNQYQFPPMVSKCPDYWVIESDGNDPPNYTCNDVAGVAGVANKANYTIDAKENIPLPDSITSNQLCDLKENLNTNNILWTGISNNDKICGLEDIE